MKLIIQGMLLLAMAAPASAQLEGAKGTSWGPKGNGTLLHQDDLAWLTFHGVTIATDEQKGVYIASFSQQLRKLDGQSFSITGYMLPVDAKTTSPHFILTRRSTGCPFCPANEPNEAIEVFLRQPVTYTQTPVRIDGVLHLLARSEQGLFFRLDSAKVG